MVKVTHTVAIGALSIPLLASALPFPVVDNNARGLTIDIRDIEGLDDLDGRGFLQSVEDGAKKVGHELKKVATSPVGQIATTVAIGALLARNPNYFEELERRGFFSNITHKVEDFFNSPFVTSVAPAVAPAAISSLSNVRLKPIKPRDFDHFDELYSRGAWKTVKEDVKKGVHKVEDFFDTPIGAAVKRIGVNQGMNQIKKYRASKSVKSQPAAIKSPTTSVEEPASKPISKPVSKAIVEERDLWELDEIEGRGLFQNLKNEAKNIGHKVENFANSPFGQVVTQTVIPLAGKVLRDLELDEYDARDFDKEARELEFDEFEARDFDLDERYFDDEFDEIYGREYEIDELD